MNFSKSLALPRIPSSALDLLEIKQIQLCVHMLRISHYCARQRIMSSHFNPLAFAAITFPFERCELCVVRIIDCIKGVDYAADAQEPTRALNITLSCDMRFRSSAGTEREREREDANKYYLIPIVIFNCVCAQPLRK
jgi:hypothetical protein